MMSQGFAILCTFLSSFRHVQLHQLSFHESIIAFLGKSRHPHVHGPWNIIIFLLKILDLLHLIFANAPIFKLQKLDLIQWVKWWWVTNGSNDTQCCLRKFWHKRCLGSNGFIQITTPKLLVEEYDKSSWELMLGWLTSHPHHFHPFQMRIVMNSMQQSNIVPLPIISLNNNTF